MLSVHRITKARRSVRRYQSKGIPDKVLRRILNAARWAPSAHNAQPWRFIVIKDSRIKLRLAEAMATQWKEDLRKDVVLPLERERLVKLSIERFTNAPVLIVAFMSMEGMNKYPDQKRRKAEHTMAIQSVAASIQNLLLAAHAEGLGSCWFCAPLFCPETVRKTLEAPESTEPQALITLGYPAGKTEPPARKPLESITFQNHWGQRE